MLRVAAYLGCASIVCGAISIHHARAEYADQTLVFGRQMLNLANASNHEVTKIIFNGQPIHVGSSVTQDGPETVLQKYEDFCKANRGQQTDDFSTLNGNSDPNNANANEGKTPGPNLSPNLTKMREDRAATGAAAPDFSKVGFQRTAGNDGEGVVVCFVKGPKTKSTTSEAFQSFVATGELGAFGELRYAYASKTPSGKTLVLSVWTDSQFNLREMVGEKGSDVPGEDFAEVPRVPSSTRVMSARADGMPYGINVYQTKNSPKQTLEYYDGEMKKQGWFAYDPEMTEEEHKGLGRSYMKNSVVVTLGTSIQDSGTFVALGLSGVAADEKLQKLGRR